MKRSIRTHLLLAFIFLVLLCLIGVPWATSNIMGLQFGLYMEERVTEEQRELVDALREAYIAENGWNLFRVADITKQTLRGPLVGVLLTDASGNLVWSARRRTMPRRDGYDFTRDLTRKILPIIVSGDVVGKLEFFSFPSPEGMEARFLDRFNYYLIIAVLGMLLIAGGLSFVVANGLSRPILRAATRANEIARGGYHSDSPLSTKIIELKTLSESLESLSRSLAGQELLRKRLMSDVAHELRTPVTVIKAQLEAMADGVLPPEQENFGACLSEADRLARLISNVENLAELEGDALVLKREKCDISGLISELVRAFSLLYHEAGIKLEQNTPQSLFAEIDRDKMKQVFENILSNALRYTDAGGELSITAREKDEKISIEFCDTGIGIDDHDLPNIFERFYRADKSRARATGGRGLGLAIAKAIVEAHGGKIHAKKNKDAGSTFTIDIV